MANSNPKCDPEAIPIRIVLEKEAPLQIKLKETLTDIPERYRSIQLSIESEAATELARIGILYLRTYGREIAIWVTTHVIAPLFVSWLYDHFLRDRNISSIKVSDNQVQPDQEALVEAIVREKAKIIERRRYAARTRGRRRTKSKQRKRITR